MRTPIRDQLGLNEVSDSLATPRMGMGGAGSRAEVARLKAMREDLRHSLGSLPAPENEYQVCAGACDTTSARVCYRGRACTTTNKAPARGPACSYIHLCDRTFFIMPEPSRSPNL